MGGKFRLSTTESLVLYLESTGLAEAKMLDRAFSVVMIPAFAMETVCCSMTSCNTERVTSLILSNSSMQHRPPSLNTSAPLRDQLEIKSTFPKPADCSPSRELCKPLGRPQTSLYPKCRSHEEQFCGHTKWAQQCVPVAIGTCSLLDLRQGEYLYRHES